MPQQEKGSSVQVTAEHWPYPRWIAHRGAGKLAPENTLAAFRLGASHGYRMFECDVKLSADFLPFLMHDATLDRTTSGTGVGGALPWAELSILDAGGWHSRAYAGEPLPSLSAIARFCLRNNLHLNVEIKPTPGTEMHTGRVVANELAQIWDAGHLPPLLTSFETAALEGARIAQPQLPRGLLVDELWTGWLEAAVDLGCVAIVANYRLWSASTVALVKQAGIRTLSYTVNDAQAVQQLIMLQTDGIITDRVDLFTPSPEA